MIIDWINTPYAAIRTHVVGPVWNWLARETIVGPYYVDAQDTFQAGATASEAFSAGSVAGDASG